MPCYTPFFNKSERQLMESWITLCSSVCLLSTTITMVSFLIDRKRQFSYRMTPVFFISLSFFFVSVG